MDALERYSEIITPWATKVAENFTADIARQNEKQWRQHSRNISAELRNMVDRAPVGQVMKSIVAEQIKYIKSLPLEAADRVYDIQNKAIEAVVAGGRAEPFAKEIAASGDVSRSRANLIARTELGRATGALDQARALSIGSNGYIWRTAEDGDVRHSHREMEGKFVEWGRPPTLDGMELGWTVVELAAAQQVGRPIDTQKYDGMQLKWQMDNDEQVYIGDDALGLKGLANLVGVTLNNAPKTWANSTNDEILDSVNSILSNAWAASGYSVVPSDLRIPPEQYSLLASRKVSEAGNQSLLTYLAVNTIAFHQNGVPLEIKAVKWLKGRGVGGKDRMVAYTNDKKYVRYPLVPLQSVPIQYRGLYQIATYYGKLGAVEPVYKETLSYVDGI